MALVEHDLDMRDEAYQSLDSLGPDIMRLLEDFETLEDGSLEDVPGGMVQARAALESALDTPALSLGLPHSPNPPDPAAGDLLGPASPPISAFAQGQDFALAALRDAQDASASKRLRQALAASTLNSASGNECGGGMPPSTRSARMNIRRTRTATFAPVSPVAEQSAAPGMLRRVVSGSDLATTDGAALPQPAASTGMGAPGSAATTVKMETLRLESSVDGSGSNGMPLRPACSHIICACACSWSGSMAPLCETCRCVKVAVY